MRYERIRSKLCRRCESAGPVSGRSGDDELRDLAHGCRCFTEQEIGDPILTAAGVERERVARREAMIEHKAREQQTTRIAAVLMDAVRLPGEVDRARHMIERTRRPARIRFVGGIAGDALRKADRRIDIAAQTVAEGDRHGTALIEARREIGGERGLGAVTADSARQPSQIEPRGASRSRRAQANSST